MDVGKDLVPQLKEEVNDRHWPVLPALRFKLTFLKIHKKIILAAAAGKRINANIHLKLSEAASDPPVL
jgi:hypothetical protein